MTIFLLKSTVMTSHSALPSLSPSMEVLNTTTIITMWELKDRATFPLSSRIVTIYMGHTKYHKAGLRK
ncbi:hypothetical protein EJB05_52665, partial [Eragrostis curvula]